MPAYQGGKQMHGKAIKAVMEKYERDLVGRELDLFVPFAGMCGVARQFGKKCSRKIEINDINPDVIALLRAARNKSWDPPQTCTREEFDRLKKTTRISAKKGFIGIACSYNGNFFRGYRDPEKYKTKSNRDFMLELKTSLPKVLRDLKGVNILPPASYASYSPNGKIIYADPPYKNNNINTPFFKGFDHDEFWNVMREWSKCNLVFVSEFTAPTDFISVWEGVTRRHNHHVDQKCADKLFMYARPVVN